MPIDLEDGSIHVYDARRPPLIRRDTNTVMIRLHEDEIFALIEDLARRATEGGGVLLTIEKDIIYPKEVF